METGPTTGAPPFVQLATQPPAPNYTYPQQQFADPYVQAPAYGQQAFPPQQQQQVYSAPGQQAYYQQPPTAYYGANNSQWRPPPPPPQQSFASPQPSGYMPHAMESLPAVEKTIADMQTRGMHNDPRYHQMIAIANRLRQQMDNGGSQQAPPQASPTPLAEQEQTMFDAQVIAYRTLARQMPVPVDVAQRAMRDPHRPPVPILPEPYAVPGKAANGERLPYNLMSILQLHQQRAQRVTTVPRPVGIDPQTIIKERENRIANRIGERIAELESIVATIDEGQRIKVEIELRSLRLLNLQKQLRGEVVALMRRDTTLETALNPNAYRRTKKQSLREARVTEKLEKQQKMAQEKKRRERHKEFLDAIINHSREFKEHHRNNQIKLSKIKRAIMNYHANAEKERKKDEERREKERMQKLMQEDEEGYRKLLDQKKDKRLVYLLEQTDEYVASLTGLVEGHQMAESKRKKAERKAAREQRRREREEQRRHEAEAAGGEVSNQSGNAVNASMGDNLDDSQADLHVRVKCTKTGKTLHGEDAPKASQLDAWLETHPGYEVVARGDDSSSTDSEDSEGELERKQRQRVADEQRAEAAQKQADDENERMMQIMQKARNEDDEYHATQEQEGKSYYNTAHKMHEGVTVQPTICTGGQLKPYQIKGLEWLLSLYNNNLNGILADEMGLGKTIQTIALITYLMEYKKLKGPYLIIVPLSTMSNWDMEFDKWAPSVVKIGYKGNPQVRRLLQSKIKAQKFNVLLTTYDYIIKDKAILAKVHWKYMIIDEGHRMKNHHNKLTMVLNTYYTSAHRLLLTGTPLQNKLPELWALLNFLLPSIFKSCSTFEQWFNAPFATTGEKVELNSEETMLIIRRLHKVLRPFLLRRLKKEVESQLPEKTEYVIKCDTSALQRVLYKSLKNGLLVGGSAQGAKAVMNTVMQLRKLCNHPFLFEQVEEDCRREWKIDHITGKELYRVSGKFELLDRILPKLRTSGHKILLFCQMTNLMTIMEDFFAYRGYKYLRLDGSTKPDERGDLLAQFSAVENDYFIFLLSTRAGGLGLNLQTADTVIIFDSDWNPHMDLQAQDRAHRIGQSREVRVLRLMTVNSIEERILAAARSKLNMDSKVIQAGLFDNRSTGAERRKFLEQVLTAEVEDDDENEVPDDELVNQMLARSEDEFDTFQRMDIERRRVEAAEFKRRPRLVEDDEVPQQYFKNNELCEQMAAGEIDTEATKALFGQGKRARKEVNYAADLMSEREWLKEYTDEQVEEDEFLEDDEETQRLSSKATSSKKGRGAKRKPDDSRSGGASSSRRRLQMDEEEAEDDEIRSQTDGGDAGRKRGRRGALTMKTADRPVAGPRPRSPPPDWVALMCQQMFKVITSIRASDDRVLAEPFMKLPTARELPDYYERIERPMDFKRIQKKLDKYHNIDEMADDVFLLCSNAQEYNVDESIIYQDSVLLKKTWDDLRVRFREQEEKKQNEHKKQEATAPVADRAESALSSEEASRSSARAQPTSDADNSPKDADSAGRRKKASPQKRSRDESTAVVEPEQTTEPEVKPTATNSDVAMEESTGSSSAIDLSVKK